MAWPYMFGSGLTGLWKTPSEAMWPLRYSRPRATTCWYFLPDLCVSPAARNGSRDMPVAPMVSDLCRSSAS